MGISWLWVAGAAIGLPLLLNLPIRIGFSLEYRDDHAALRLSFSLGGPLAITIPVPQRVVGVLLARRGDSGAGKGDSAAPKPRRAIIAGTAKLIATFLRRIERFEWRTEFGTGDAALTGCLTGILWALKSTVLGFLSRRFVFEAPPQFTVSPLFNRTCLALEVFCIFRFTIGEIIVAVAQRIRSPRSGG